MLCECDVNDAESRFLMTDPPLPLLPRWVLSGFSPPYLGTASPACALLGTARAKRTKLPPCMRSTKSVPGSVSVDADSTQNTWAAGDWVDVHPW